MKKCLMIMVIACLAVFAFAGYKISTELGLQSSVGVSYDFGRIELGADIRSFAPATLIGIAKKADMTIETDRSQEYQGFLNRAIRYLSLDAYILCNAVKTQHFEFAAGLGVMNNPYRADNTDRTDTAAQTNWYVVNKSKVFPFQTKAVTVLLDTRFSFKFNEQHSAVIMLELPVLGFENSASHSAKDTEKASLGKYMLSVARLVRLGYTYTF